MASTSVADRARLAMLPWALVAWGATGIALNVGLARFTYGAMLPAIQRDLGIDFLGGGSLNAVHLVGYRAGTLAAPVLLRHAGALNLSRWAHLLVAGGALLCALAPAVPWAGALTLGAGRLATGLGAGAGIVAILVAVFAVTAGNAHAFLHLFARIGDERWLARARSFAMHGIAQVEQERAVHGRGRHTLWTGDLGMACVRGTASAAARGSRRWTASDRGV